MTSPSPSDHEKTSCKQGSCSTGACSPCALMKWVVAAMLLVMIISEFAG
ncbi:MAG: hypothetical protein SFW64_00730 [Alphaproteobacteria bacterium]|nr:hypothetical protein [Alphaproteobacteria bacterium]